MTALAALRYIGAEYGQPSPRKCYSAGGYLLTPLPAAVPARREFVCTRCDHGQCARCYGNED